MALLQISEPGQATAPHEHRLAAGIDLGTTNSCVAIWRKNNLEIIPDMYGNRTIPSVVAFTSKSKYNPIPRNITMEIGILIPEGRSTATLSIKGIKNVPKETIAEKASQ